jgi:hypothetical protein
MVCWAYGPAIEAFKYLRPIVGIDGTHLSGRYKGKMLVACGYDAEDHLVPLAFALVDTERNETWKIFMKFVRREVVKARRVTILTDRGASQLRLFNERNLGWSERDGDCFVRYCSRHVCQNFTTKFKDKTLIGILRRAMKQNQKRKFRNGLARLESKLKEAKNGLMISDVIQMMRRTNNLPDMIYGHLHLMRVVRDLET